MRVSSAAKTTAQASGKELRVSVGLSEQKLHVDVKPLDNGLVRVLLSSPELPTKIEDYLLSWDVRAGGKMYEAETPFTTVNSVIE